MKITPKIFDIIQFTLVLQNHTLRSGTIGATGFKTEDKRSWKYRMTTFVLNNMETKNELKWLYKKLRADKYNFADSLLLKINIYK